MIQLMVMNQILPLFYAVYHKVQSLVHYHFADDTNLLHFNKSVAKLNKLVNQDMKNLTVWLNSKKIPLNIEKNELVIFKHQRKNLTLKLK